MNKISVYVSYHDRCDLVKTDVFKPIQVGTSLHSVLYPGELNDAMGENISEKNQSFCELTAQYWVWKNDTDSDYIGFFHYRRHLILNSQNHQKSNTYGVVNYDHIDDAYLQNIGYSDQHIQYFLSDADIIVPEKWNVRNLYAKNNLEQYKHGEYLDIQDYYKCLSILCKKYPEYLPIVRQYNMSRYGYYTNIFIMKRHIFMQYSAWLFDILFELEKHLDLNDRNLQEYRVFGYLSEWLLGIYITKLEAEKQFRIKHCRRTFITNTHTDQYSLSASRNQSVIAVPQDQDTLKLARQNYKKIVPIVTAFNENYAVSGAALLQSLADNSDPECFYDVYIIEGALSDLTRFNFKIMMQYYQNFKVSIINVDYYFAGKTLGLYSHFSKETYYRILIPQLLPYYNKVIYLDADLVVNKDVQALFDIDIGDHYVGGVKDYVMAGFIKQGNYTRPECGNLPAKEYLTQYLGLKHPENYVQAGVLIFNTEQIRKNQIDTAILEAMSQRYYWFLDQDLLNKYCEGHIHYLDMKWNVLHGNGDVGAFKKLPLSIMKEYFAARKDPWIIHYAGEKKPWLYKTIDYAEIFFFYLQKTPWGSAFGLGLSQKEIHQKYHIRFPSNMSSYKSKVKDLLRPALNRFFPLGSTKRRMLQKIYRRFV